jgi:hypothetical protein
MADATDTDKQNPCLETVVPQTRGTYQDYSKKFIKREKVTDMMERGIQKKENVTEDLQRICAVLREWVANSARLKEQMKTEMEKRESEIFQKFIDEKEKIRIMNERRKKIE